MPGRRARSAPDPDQQEPTLEETRVRFRNFSEDALNKLTRLPLEFYERRKDILDKEAEIAKKIAPQEARLKRRVPRLRKMVFGQIGSDLLQDLENPSSNHSRGTDVNEMDYQNHLDALDEIEPRFEPNSYTANEDLRPEIADSRTYDTDYNSGMDYYDDNQYPIDNHHFPPNTWSDTGIDQFCENELTRVFAEVKLNRDLDYEEEQIRNEPSPHRDCKFIDTEGRDRLLLDNSLANLTEDSYYDPIVQAVLSSDSYAFFDEIQKSTRLGDKGKCDPACWCKMKFSQKHTLKDVKILHFAVAVSTDEFVENIIVKYEEFTIRNGWDAATFNHYYKTVFVSWDLPSCYGMSPAVIAAALGRPNVLNTICHAFTPLESEVKAAIRDDNKDRTLGVLEFLIANSILRQVEPNNLEEILDYTTPNQFADAERAGAKVANLDFSGLIERQILKPFEQINYIHQTRGRQYSENIFPDVPGKQQSSSGKEVKFYSKATKDNIFFPVVHLIALNGNFDMFNQLAPEEKLRTDEYWWSALVPMLQFTDEQLRSQLKYFWNVSREDWFMFISQIIITKRESMLQEVLEMVFSNVANFQQVVNNQKWYRYYGLPENYPLPMETALTRTGDIRLLETIATFYDRHRYEFTQALIREDANRCILSIQDKACKISEHLRLALILLVIRFTEQSSRKFQEAMNLYYGKDRISDYLKYHKRFEQMKRYFGWEDAFNTAREMLRYWDRPSFEPIIPYQLFPNVGGIGENRIPARKIILTKEELIKKKESTKKKPKNAGVVYNNIMEAMDRINELPFVTPRRYV